MRVLNILAVLAACVLIQAPVFAQLPVSEVVTVDESILPKARNLYLNLWNNAGSKLLFGHQDDLAYGVGWKEKEKMSDVWLVTGRYPAVMGWELCNLGREPENIDGVKFDNMKRWMLDAYKMGAVNTISWHLQNPVSDGSAWDPSPAVYAILPGGEKHEAYKKELRTFADFASSMRAGFPVSKPIPLIFRPFHEHSGSWFWWGKGNCTSEEYKALWRFTVSFLRDTCEVHNLLYAYSTDIVPDKEAYLEYYPGDEYVDILGMDDYHDFRGNGESREVFTRRMAMLGNLGLAKGKVSALTETGSEQIPDSSWWTRTLLAGIEADPLSAQISYVMVWRNGRPDHYYAPYPGHPSVPDFVTFTSNERVQLSDKRASLYRKPKSLRPIPPASPAALPVGMP